MGGHSSPPHERENTTLYTNQEPTLVQLDPKCLHSALREFFEPLRTNDPRTDFFAIYRKESEEFDRDYVNKYNEDLNTSLIFAGLFSAVSSAFIIDVQSNLQPDPNAMTAAYMQVLIHAVNNTLFPDANPSSTTWAGPPPEIVTVQSLLYASLATSLFSAFLAMLGKQWVARYLRNNGGSAADKSRDRQQKLDGFKKWHFYLAIESLPVMLQCALLLFSCALSLYLWSISGAVAGVVLAFTVFGITSYVFITGAAIFCYQCPYQTPPSIIVRATIGYFTHNDNTFIRSLRSFFPSSIKNIWMALGRLHFKFRDVLGGLRRVSFAEEVERIPLAVVCTPPTRIFEETPLEWWSHTADAQCISWMLDSTTDTDVILSTVRFAADMIWYPKMAGVVSPHGLANLFFDCLRNGQVIPGKSEHAISVGMALASVLSIRLSMEPEDKDLRVLCERINLGVGRGFAPRSTLALVVTVLRLVARDPTPRGSYVGLRFYGKVPHRLSTTHKLWLSRILLQTTWRWTRVHGTLGFLHSRGIGSICGSFTGDDDRIPAIFRTNYFLIMAISLGLKVSIHDLYAPDNDDALRKVIRLFHRQLHASIAGGVGEGILNPVLSALADLNPLRVMQGGESEELGFMWIDGILNSGYQEDVRYGAAGKVIKALGRFFFPDRTVRFLDLQPKWIPPLLGFLSLYEKLNDTKPPVDPAFIALCILSTFRRSPDYGVAILPILTPALFPTNPLRSRVLALNTFVRFMSGWFPPHTDKISREGVDNLLRAVGDPFDFPDLPHRDDGPIALADYKPMMAAVVLIELASSELWRGHLQRSNFISCEEIVSTREGQRSALSCMLEVGRDMWTELLCTAAKINAAIRRLEELQCYNTAEVVIMWAWTVGVVDPLDHDDWKLIGRETIRFCQTHGTRRLIALKQHVVDTTKESMLLRFLEKRYWDSPRRVVDDRYREPIPKSHPRYKSRYWYYTDFCVAQACQVRRLYHLFGYDPKMWKEIAVAEAGRRGEDAFPGHSVMPVSFIDWRCDYP